ncbi:MAG: family 43 glycosylhydrolase [Eubacteriales bacterium]|nr:family 43 glycosylhydrolase [Eubacteriales bacterium]
MNPILPLYYAAPDVEAHVWPQDPDRVYLYCSNDRIDGGGMDSYQNCFSSTDLVHWEDHGVAFDARKAVTWTKVDGLPAVDAAEKDGRYYYYFTAPVDGVLMQCVASSDRPEGPFTNPVPIKGTEYPSCGDPSVLVDDDGKAYLFWGQFSLRGARLKDNMCELEEDTVDTMVLTEQQHGFHEGSSIRKRGDTYYLLYADTDRGRPTCLSYAKSKSPLGPYVKGGVIIDNVNCDIASWNNHGSMLCFHDQWYIVYHRATLGLEMGGRRVCLEPITFDENGDIAEVQMTTQGIEAPLPAGEWTEAYRACEFLFADHSSHDGEGGAFFIHFPLRGWNKNMVDCGLRNAKDNGVRTAHRIRGDVHSEYLTRFVDGDAAIYRSLLFTGKEREFVCEAASYLALTRLELRLDAADGPCIGTCEISHSGGWEDWKEYRCRVEAVSGVHALYLVARDGGEGHRLCDLKRFRFEE